MILNIWNFGITNSPATNFIFQVINIFWDIMMIFMFVFSNFDINQLFYRRILKGSGISILLSILLMYVLMIILYKKSHLYMNKVPFALIILLPLMIIGAVTNQIMYYTREILSLRQAKQFGVILFKLLQRI